MKFNNLFPRTKQTLAVKNKAGDVYLYDVIGADFFGGISAKDFADQIAEGGSELNIYINSPGGDVFEARAMVANLRRSDATKTAYIDGVAASAASWLALACNRVVMSEGALFMIHNSWTFAGGDARTLRGQADLLEKIDNEIVSDYVKKTGLSEDEIRGYMDAETWFSAAEALEKGFVDEILADKKAQNFWDLSAYDNAPKTVENFDEARAAALRRLQLIERNI